MSSLISFLSMKSYPFLTLNYFAFPKTFLERTFLSPPAGDAARAVTPCAAAGCSGAWFQLRLLAVSEGKEDCGGCVAAQGSLRGHSMLPLLKQELLEAKRDIFTLHRNMSDFSFNN